MKKLGKIQREIGTQKFDKSISYFNKIVELIMNIMN